MDSAIIDAYPADWDNWVLTSLAELEESENVGLDTDLLATMPPWSQGMLEEVLKVMVPTIKWRTDGQTGPEYLGKLLGHQEYLLKSEEAEDSFEKQMAKIKNSATNPSSASNVFTERQSELLLSVWPAVIEYWGLILKHLLPVIEKKTAALERCRERAFEQPFEVIQEFNKAYSQAQSTSLYTEAGDIDGLSNWNKVRMTLLIFMPIVNHPAFFKSIPDLYRWILRVHKYKVISSGSFRKMCNSHGLSYAKNREK